MKKFFAFLLTICLVLALAACGGSAAPAETVSPAPETTAATEPETTAAPETEPATEPDAKEIAKGLIDAPVAELYEAIGYPESSDYAPSCLKEGAEDGNLYYDGFTVYTIRSGEEETVYYVE